MFAIKDTDSRMYHLLWFDEQPLGTAEVAAIKADSAHAPRTAELHTEIVRDHALSRAGEVSGSANPG